MGVKYLADGKVTIDSELNDKGLDKGIRNLQSKMESTGKQLQNIGGKLTKGLTLPIVAAGTGALLMASKFDDSMRTVKATMGKNLGESTKEADANFKALREEALKLGATTAHSASDASGAMKELAQMGYDTNQILSSTGTVLDVASASGLELDFVATTLAGSMNQFGVEVDDNGVNIKRFGDVMVRAGQMSGTSMEEIAHALEYVGSSAHNSGMDIEQTSAYIGILGDQSIKGGKAGTALNAMLRDMKSKVSDGNLEFEDFNVAMYDSQGNMRDMTDIMEDLETGLEGKSDAERDAALSAVFGSQAQTAVNAILGEGTDQVREYENELKLANDTAKIAAGEMEGGIGGALRGLASASEAIAIAFGDVLAPAVQKIAQFVAKMFLKFTELSDGMKKAVVVVAAVLAAIGPLLTMLGTILIVVPKLAAAIAGVSAPILIAIGVIAALVAIGVALYKNWDTVKEKATEVFSNFAPLLDTVKGAFQDLKSSVTPIMDNLKSLWESLVPILEKLAIVVGSVLAVSFGVAISVFSAVVSAIGPLIGAFVSLADFIASTINFVIAILTGDFAGAMEYWNDMTEAAIGFFKGLWDGVVNFFTTFIDTIIDFFHGLYMTLVGNSIIPDMVEAIVEWFTNMWEWLVEIVSGLVDGVVEYFTNLYERASEIFQTFWDFLVDVWDYISETFQNALDFILALVTGDFEGMKDAMQNQMKNAQNLLSNIWDTIKSLIGEKASQILTDIIAKFIEIKNNIQNKTTEAKDALVKGFTDMVSNAKKKAQEILTNVTNKFNEVKTNITNKITEAKNALVNKFTEMVTNATKKAQEIVTAAKEKFEAVKNGIRDKLTEAVTVVGEKIGEMPGKVMEFFGDMVDVGKNLVAGLINGIKQMGSNAIEAVTGVVDGVIDKAKGLLKIASPSKLFTEFGGFVSQGLAVGIEKMKGLAESASEALAGGIEGAFNPELSVGDLKGIPQLKGITADSIIGNIIPVAPSPGKPSSNNQGNGDGRSVVNNVTNHFTPAESTPAESARKQKQELQKIAMGWR